MDSGAHLRSFLATNNIKAHVDISGWCIHCSLHVLCNVSLIENEQNKHSIEDIISISMHLMIFDLIVCVCVCVASA